MHHQGRSHTSTRGIKGVSILAVDEADAIVQSREARQMYHEDRAGVDAFLAGVDSLAGAHVPVLVVLYTNRPGALDPAIMRRSAATLTFDRPTDDQRVTALRDALYGVNISRSDFERLVAASGPRPGKPGFTYSDLTQRLVPTAVLEACFDVPVTGPLLISVAEQMDPTPVFGAAT